MRLVVIGAGAMGGLFAARLAPHVSAVQLIDANPDLAQQIAEAGLQVSGLTEAVVRSSATDGQADDYSVLVMVKNHHTSSVVADHADLLSGARFVTTLQNGWGGADVLADAISPKQLVIGVTYASARVDGLGRISHTSQGLTYVGPYEADGDVGPATEFAELLRRAELEAVVTPRVRDEIWRKLTLNAATLAASALTDLRARRMPESASLMALVDELVTETVSVARSLGLDVDVDERRQTVHAVLANAGEGKGSMMQDIEARRRTEVDAINGAVVRAADQTGVLAPLNRAMRALVHGLEQSWSA